MWREWKFTADQKHGLGILFGVSYTDKKCKVFYEDNTLKPTEKSVERDEVICWLRDYKEPKSSRSPFPSSPVRTVRKKKNAGKAVQEPEQPLSENAVCDFLPGPDGCLEAEVRDGDRHARIHIRPSGFRSFTSECSCGNSHCVHLQAAASVLQRRLLILMHSYIVTPLDVDKGEFLEPPLEILLTSTPMHSLTLTAELISQIRRVIQLADSADSTDYYQLIHDYVTDIYPPYDDYRPRFMEERFTSLFLALFEDPGYRAAVLEDEYYEDADDYEDRQERSNRVSFKRILKEYRKTVKELDVQHDFSENTCKEFLLKYRGDLPALLRYLAIGKKALDPADISFLEEIADAPDIDLSYIPAVTEKLDQFGAPEQLAPVFRRLLQRLPSDQRVELYTRFRHFTMSMDEVRTLSPEDQRRMVNNLPLTAGNFRYAIDELLAGSDPVEKGHFLLRMTARLTGSKDSALKRAVAEQAALLPDSRLLLAYIVYSLHLRGGYTAQQGTPEKELAAYFRCGYHIIVDTTGFVTLFSVSDPESGEDIVFVEERDGILHGTRSPLGDVSSLYPPALIRQVCLAGREEAYRAEAEKQQEAADARNFERSNKKFATEYRQLCESLKNEKLLFTETAKAGIDWQIYREGTSNALSCKVGNTRKYVVKDLPEFIRAFRSGQTTEYGKDLILTHEPENLNDTDAAVVKLLMSAKYTRGRKSDRSSKRYITVSDSLLGNMLELLSGRNVLFNDMPCQLRMEPRKLRLRVDSSYTLSSGVDTGTQEFLDLVGKGYLLERQKDSSSAVLDRVDGTAEEIGLIDLVNRNPGVCVKPILPDFRRNIYSRFFEIIDVDKTVQRDFTLSQLRLNTYFDFEKSVITARTVILKEGKEVPADSLSERIDQVRVERLQNYLRTLGFADGVLAEESHILSFFKLDFTKLKSLTNVYLSENLQNKELKTVGRPVIRVTYKNNLVNVFLEKSEYSEVELEQIIAGLRKKKKFILLSGNRIVDLDSETARDLGEAVKDFGMNPKDLYRKKTISMVNAIKAFSHERSCRVDKYLRDMIEEIRSFKEADIALPKLNGELREYQAEGYKWMSILAGYGMGGILADDMGLGKTIQVIALIRADRTRRPTLVVCPKSLVFNWISEFSRFDGATQVTAIYGPESQRSGIIAGINYGEKAVYVTSYDSLRNDIGKYTGEFNFGILDEAQYIKNVHAQKTLSVKELQVRHRFALTGTPIENSVVDLWSIFDYIMPGYFDELSQFKSSDTAVIARKAAPFILRRVKEDVLEDLPPKYERILSADMTDGQRKIYEALRQDARKQLEAGGKAFDILPYLTRLRQVCVDPGMFAQNYSGGSGKLDLLAVLIPEYLTAHHRILIFSQFVKALESVDRLLKSLDIPAYFLSGATSAADRIEMMESFNSGSGADIFLISLKAGGTGLNLTGADTVIHLDPWWNVAAENQASDRTHRIGQTRNVEVIRLIAGDSIEQRVVELQDIKKEVIRQVISDDDGSVTSARLEDIAFVLE